MEPAVWLPLLLGTATMLPLLSFFLILVFGPRMGTAGQGAGRLAIGAIGLAALLSFFALAAVWLPHHWPTPSGHGEHAAADHDSGHDDHSSHDESITAGDAHSQAATHDGPVVYAGEFQIIGLRRPWLLAQIGDLRLSVSYYIDALTVCMFCMVTLIATLIHIYSVGYMHEELSRVTDPEVKGEDGRPLEREGRYHRFFQYLSLFSFSMLGLVLAGNVALVFVFWELVGICSYFLIGFYIERKSASTAANKAFIVNRVGDFGMIIGLMALWTGLGTLSFADVPYEDASGQVQVQPGIFRLIEEAAPGQAPAGMAMLAERERIAEVARRLGPGARPEEIEQALAPGESHVEAHAPAGTGPGYWLLIVAGVGIFAGCVGKSAQFPLHVWLPDAMEGPTPVSALVHSATMVAAGVYLVGRFYPAFVPEVLIVIAVVGTITLFLAATIAITATDIKRVLAYSTISQLGYMMMALGVGAWLAGMMHLITHAFFKSLLFMCSGSVIHAVHTNEMPEMGGLLKKMPVTALTMLVGCLAISGAGLPFVAGLLGGPHLAGLGLSGFYSKDAILEQAFSFMSVNGSALSSIFFIVAAAGAAITAFYMFRLWYLTFAGKPRNEHRYEHAHESPPSMYVPLIILAVMATVVAWRPAQGLLGSLIVLVVFGIWRIRRKGVPRGRADLSWGDIPWATGAGLLLLSIFWWITPLNDVVLSGLLGQAEPARIASGWSAVLVDWRWPSEHAVHRPEIILPVTFIALSTALAGFVLATLMYGTRRLDPAEVRQQFERLYQLLWNKWWFDELYDRLFVRPVLALSQVAAWFDRSWIDWIIDGMANTTRRFAQWWERLADQSVVDGFVNAMARWTYAVGVKLRRVQTGQLRQYVMFIVVGAIALLVLINLLNSTLAG